MRIFISRGGRLRAGWVFLITAAAWYCASALIALGVSRALAAMFKAWGVTNANLHLAPAWVQLIAAYQTGIFTAASALASAAVGALLMRRRARASIAPLIAFASGAAAAAALAGIFILADSMRLVTRTPEWSVNIPITLAICLISALGEGMLALGFMREAAAKHGGRAAGYAAATALLFIMDGGYARDIPGMINTLLAALLLCHVAEKSGGVGAAVALKTGWTWSAAALIGFPGSEGALLSLYPVSENLLTGGKAGIMSGLAVTLICGAIIWFSICMPHVKVAIRQIKARKKANNR